MKVYTKVVINMTTGEILEEQFHEYHGPVALCDFGTDVTVPPPTAQETELMQRQIDALTSAEDRRSLLDPYMLKSLRLREVDGKLEEIPYDEWVASLSPAEQRSLEIEKEAEEYLLRSIKGEQPLSASFEAYKERTRSVAEEELRRAGHEEGSTPWNQRMSELDRQMGALEEDIRFGRMGTAQAIATGEATDLAQRQSRFFQQGSSYSDSLGKDASAYNAPLSILKSWRDMELQGNIASAQADASFWGGLGQTAGTLGGFGIMKWG